MADATRLDPEATADSMEDTDPLEELTGWHAEPELLRCLNLYIGEGIVECGAISVAMRRVCAPPGNTNLTLPNQEFFTRLLMLPLCIAALKLAWALCLAFGYYRHSGVVLAKTLGRRRPLERRSFWSLSAAMLVCLSCMLMMWYAIICLCLVCVDFAPQERQVARFAMCLNGLFALTHGFIWRDFVTKYRGTVDVDPVRFERLERLCGMYKYRAIQLLNYMDAVDQKTSGSRQSTCMICMEDFAPTKCVSLLPCGHCFHPVCANKWLCEKWVCPMRCPLGDFCASEIGATADAASPVVPIIILPDGVSIGGVLPAQQ